MEITVMVVIIAVILAIIAFVIFTVERIKNARALGKKMHKRNRYYALVTRLFIRDLPD